MFSVIVAALVFNSCNNRKDYFYDLDVAPTLQIYDNASQGLTSNDIYDSLKIGVSYNTNFTFTSQVKSEVTATQTQGSDSIYIENDKIYIMPKTAGQSVIQLKATDSFNKSACVNMNFTVFTNLLPVAVFAVNQITGGLSPYEVQIDASASYDRDSKWGGKIVAYNYKINTNYNVTSELSSIRYIFDTSGQKKITVRVQDNSGDWSEEKTIYIIVN